MLVVVGGLALLFGTIKSTLILIPFYKTLHASFIVGISLIQIDLLAEVKCADVSGS